MQMSLRATAIASMLPFAFPSTAQTLQFSEVAAASGMSFRHTPPVAPTSTMVGGGAVGDFNGDGWPDVFLLGGGGRADGLFINNGDGTFTDRATEFGVAATHLGVGVAVGDYDGDGWSDLFVTSFGLTAPETPGQHRLYRNLGGSGFEEVAQAAGVATTSPVLPDGWGASFGDYDLDGDLDLFVAGWLENSGGNVLFRNNGDGTFTNVTLGAVAFDLSQTNGFAPRFVDMDGDRWPEILLAADYGTSRYLINNQNGTFTEYTAPAGLGLDTNGMGQCVGDFNNDGLFDWYVTSIYGSADQTGNMLYINQGAHQYIESGLAAGVRQAGWGWGALAVDFDHDGMQDILATNGWTGAWQYDPTRLYLNQGALLFTDQAVACGINHKLQGRAVMNFDYDLDGDQDIVLLSLGQDARLYRNDLSGAGTSWLRIELDRGARTDIAPHGLGSVVRVTAAGQTQVRAMSTGDNYLSQSEASVHFGLGGAAIIDELRVEWVTGEVTTWHSVAVNQSSIVQPPQPGDVDGDGDVDLSDLGELLSAYGACLGDADYIAAADFDGDSCIGLGDLGVLLSAYGT